MTCPKPLRPRYEYGRHETFPVRHGWLAKGLHWMKETGAFRPDLETADALGLGSRMVKSLRFWLEASGLAQGVRRESARGSANGRVKEWRITESGETIARNDPYLEYPGTWWWVHLSLARSERTVWGWFFNDFNELRFDRESCVAAFRAHRLDHASNPPSLAVAQRDVSCLLQAYAKPAVRDRADPEDATWCPLRDLGLVSRQDATSRFEKARPLDEIPSEVFLASVSTLALKAGSDSVSLGELARIRNGPQKVLGLESVQIEKLVDASTAAYSKSGVHVTLLGSEYHLVLPNFPATVWLEEYFRRVKAIVA